MKPLLATLTLASLLLAGCDKKEVAKPASASQSPKQEAQAQAQSQQPLVSVPDSFQAGIGKVYAGYLTMGSALARDDFAPAESASHSMLTALRALPKAGMDSAALNQWNALEARMMPVLGPMAEAKDMAAMRDRMADFTPLMVEAIEKFGSLGSDQAFLFHCPMARNNQGADWIQKDKKTQNPFLGKAMPECGSFVKDVKL